jgi:cysteine desulfurase/selenocysteine lyase
MAQAVGLGAALTYLTGIGMEKIHQHEIALTKYLLEGLSAISDLRIIGPKTTELRGGVVSFTLGDIHPHDLGQYLDSQGIAVRTGHHCAWPLTRKLGVPATTRASVYLYNTTDDLDALIVGVQGAQKYFGR